MELLTVGILFVDLFCSLIHRKLTFNSMRMRQQQKIGFGNTEEQIVELACEKFERLIVGHPVRYLLGIPSVHCTPLGRRQKVVNTNWTVYLVCDQFKCVDKIELKNHCFVF